MHLVHHAPRVVLLKLVEGFIVSVDSVFFVPRHSSLAVFWGIPSLAAEELEIDGMKALTKNAW